MKLAENSDRSMNQRKGMIEKIDTTLEKAANQGNHDSDTISYLVKRRASLQKKHQA